jgi:hypothetical protein
MNETGDIHGEPHYYDLDHNDPTNRLEACSVCGAVVYMDWEERHTEWHAWLGRTIGVVA